MRTIKLGFSGGGQMFGLVRKKKVLDYAKGIKVGNRATDIYAKYPPEDIIQKKLNCYSQGYEDGIDNFYNALKSFLEK